ncbi:hypothetical protein ACHAPU_008500 [Fusarium lateritium]
MGIDSDNSVSYHYFPMEEYSSTYWTQYAKPTRESEESVESIINFLQDEKSIQRWAFRWPSDDMMHKSLLESSLYWTCHYGLAAAVRELLARGADVNARGGTHGNALNAALLRGHIEVVNLLLDSGADVNLHRDGSGFSSALQVASYCGQLEVMQLLLNNGADANAQQGSYGSALVAASYNGNPESLRLLLENGADVNAPSNEHGYALVAASSRGLSEAVQVLLENRAEVNIRSGNFGSALEAARSYGHSTVIQ